MVVAAAIGKEQPCQHDEPEQHHDVIQESDDDHDQAQKEECPEKMMTPPVAAIAAVAVAMEIEILAIFRAHLFLERALLFAPFGAPLIPDAPALLAPRVALAAPFGAACRVL